MDGIVKVFKVEPIVVKFIQLAKIYELLKSVGVVDCISTVFNDVQELNADFPI